ncbi:membrane protein YfhO [bacterium A37T11]|nr:membrane protein YfhO [bacterium A37T11]
MKYWFNKNATHFAIIGIFIAICFIYFTPAWQGKVLIQGDVFRAEAGQQEIMHFMEKDGKAPIWTNSMFGGMPAYLIWIEFPSNVATYISRYMRAIFPNTIDVMMLYLLGAYLLFNSLGLRPWLAALGSVALAFTSYNFIYVEAGHINQAFAISVLPAIIAGIIWAFRQKYLLGAVVLAFAMALEIRFNHIQVTYYLFIAVLVLLVIQGVYAYKQKAWSHFFKAVGYLAGATVIAVAVNAGLLWTTYEYSQESIRGHANLKTETKSADDKGLDKEYAYQWSQGIGENLTFLIPNAYGGGNTGNLDGDSNFAKILLNNGVPAGQAADIAKNAPTYWGAKPFTSGPWYFGAIVIFLFVLGLFIVKGPIKWWVVIAGVLCLFLSFGKNFPFISDLFFDYFPMYNKFRAVESILVIVAILVPILAVLAVDEVLKADKKDKKLAKKLLYALYITGGITLLIALLPEVFLSFRKGDDVQQFVQMFGVNQQVANELVNALVKDRVDLARSDAFRSFLFVLIGFASVWFLYKGKLKPASAIWILIIFVLIDMWSVDRRFLNKNNFVEKSRLKDVSGSTPREVDNLIRMDKDPDYRVLDLTSNPFTNASTSYFHLSIGGYHAAKLMRYQELVERQFTNSVNEDVLDMLNTRYVITSDNKNSQRIQKRSSAAGNAWFVDKVTFVKDNEEEMKAINSFDPNKEAFINQEFKSVLNDKRLGHPGNSSIHLVSYRPDNLKYEYSAPNDVMAVFSEIWYDKGWKAFVDGKQIPYVRANYVLRAAQLPGGNHQVEFKFEPSSYYTGEKISLIASILLILALIFVIWRENKENKVSVKA